jgi:hypothetical protein
MSLKSGVVGVERERKKKIGARIADKKKANAPSVEVGQELIDKRKLCQMKR